MNLRLLPLLPLILALGLVPTSTALEALDVLERSIAYHDPEGAWSSRAIDIVTEVRLAERLATERGYTVRTDRIVVDNAAGRFRCLTERAGDRIEIVIDGEVFQTRLNGRSEISDEDRQKHRLADDQLTRLRNYFTFMFGIPMKLRDPGTRLDPDVQKTRFEGRDVLALRVTYEPEVGNDIWYFYFDPKTYALVGCRFYHDEVANDGEYIVFDGEVRGLDGLRLPKRRLWHMNRDGEYIAADEIVSIKATVPALAQDPQPQGYRHLLELFQEWRAFEHPPLLDGAPDYTEATFEKRQPAFEKLRSRLEEIDRSDWPIDQQVDWHLVRAEMNGYDFNVRVLRPWTRDPAFYKSIWSYKSDVPAHEGPTHHAVTELWTYKFPLSVDEEQRLIADLATIPPLMKQAQKNLTGNARDLWVTGIRDIRRQRETLDGIQAKGAALKQAVEEARKATDKLIGWLQQEAPTKTGPSGIGKDNYTWYLQNVHLVPLTWEDEVRLLRRELDRAWSSLKLEEHRNRNLPPLVPASTPEEYDRMADRAATQMMRFLREQDILTVADYMEPALRERLGSFVPEDRRNFFWIVTHHDPRPLYSHFYHWFELARMESEPHPSPIRRGALLYNIFDSRNEGTATGVEEMFMHAGLYDDTPRARELVWIMLAQRAARGLGSLYAHANEMTMEEAGAVHVRWTPRGWMKTEKELLIFEQHLYLRQPGYGTSYVTGKYLLERTLAAYAKQLEESGGSFRLRDFFDRLNRIDSVPIAMGRWEMTGFEDELPAITGD